MFSRKNFTGLIQRNVQHQITLLLGALAKRVHLDLHLLAHQFTLDTLFAMAFGTPLGCMGADQAPSFARAFDYCQERT